jgi:protocatechuate 3,4-dioxygenase beta subunit
MTRRRRTARFLPAALAIAGAAAALAVGSAQAAARDCFSDSNPPNTMRLVGGSPQQGQVGKPFQTNLQVTLANTDGCALTGSWAGVSVVFTAPSSGAGGTFASTDTNVADVGTDANGAAIAPTFTANRTAGDYEIVASSSYGSVTLYLTNTATGVAASIAAHGSTSQSATVDGRYRPLQALVLDANGQPVSGASVDFQLTTGATGAGAAFNTGGAQTTAVTNANGIATSPGLLANGSAGRFTATASTDGVEAAVTYGLRNLAPRLTAHDRREAATVGARYRRPLRAHVTDTHGRPLQGVTVTFTLPQSATGAGATFLVGTSQATATTNAHGDASSPPLIANSSAGRFTATATIATAAIPVTYSLRNVAGTPATITSGAASGESATTGNRFPIRLAVTVTDKDGNPVPGAIVTFTAPTHGPSGRFGRGSRVVRVRTNGKGVAVAPPFRANTQAGGYAVTARAGRATIGFALVNSPR